MKIELAKSTDCFEFCSAMEEHLKDKPFNKEECFSFCFSSIIKDVVVLSKLRKKVNGFSISKAYIRPDGTTLDLCFLHGSDEIKKALIENFKNYAKNIGCTNIILSYNNAVERIK